MTLCEKELRLHFHFSKATNFQNKKQQFLNR